MNRKTAIRAFSRFNHEPRVPVLSPRVGLGIREFGNFLFLRLIFIPELFCLLGEVTYLGKGNPVNQSKDPFLLTVPGPNNPAASGPLNWTDRKGEVDLCRVLTGVLGPGEERGGRLWWNCPFHEGNRKALVVKRADHRWHCYGCQANGDAVEFLRRKNPSLSFQEAARLALEGTSVAGPTSSPVRPAVKPVQPTGMELEAAREAAWDASERLWLDPEAEPGRQEINRRGISQRVADAAHLGWAKDLVVPTGGGHMIVTGLTIPWFDRGGKLAGMKVRTANGFPAKYVEACRIPDRWTGIYPGPSWIRPGWPLIVCEGELDALVLLSHVGDHAAVITAGSASGRTAAKFTLSAFSLYAAHDADEPGDRAAAAMGVGCRRVKPPEGFKDWTDAFIGGVDIRAYWMDILKV